MSNIIADKARTFDTATESGIAMESPWHWSYLNAGLPVADEKSAVVLRERPFLGHIMLRGDAAQMDSALQQAINLPLATKPLSLITDEARGYSVQWMSPDEWLLIVPPGEEFATENRLREVLGDSHFSIVNVGGGQTLVEMEGEKVVGLLMKSVICDVHPDHFPAGKAVSTVFAKTVATLRRPAEHRWELIVRRSFADYIYRWLLDAGHEYRIGIVR